jgi:riboflavin synthase
MFTGIIETIGEINLTRPTPSGVRIDINSKELAGKIEVDDSIAVNGVCLTVVELLQNGFSVDAVRETLERSTLKEWRKGTQVNLELGLPATGRFDGHFVQGHVDGQASLSRVQRRGESAEMHFSCEEALAKMMVQKGSIAIDGISLTLASVDRAGFSIAVIPYTFLNTNLNKLKPGNRVNIETDIIGKYVARYLENGKEINKSTLRSWGYEL